MPVYTYRREDGTTFDIRQKFSDDPLTVDPETGQQVQRVIQAAGIIFKGSGFYINDSKDAKKTSLASNNGGDGNGNGTDAKAESSNGSGDAKSETKSDAKTETKAAAKKDD